MGMCFAVLRNQLANSNKDIEFERRRVRELQETHKANAKAYTKLKVRQAVPVHKRKVSHYVQLTSPAPAGAVRQIQTARTPPTRRPRPFPRSLPAPFLHEHPLRRYAVLPPLLKPQQRLAPSAHEGSEPARLVNRSVGRPNRLRHPFGCCHPPARRRRSEEQPPGGAPSQADSGRTRARGWSGETGDGAGEAGGADLPGAGDEWGEWRWRWRAAARVEPGERRPFQEPGERDQAESVEWVEWVASGGWDHQRDPRNAAVLGSTGAKGRERVEG